MPADGGDLIFQGLGTDLACWAVVVEYLRWALAFSQFCPQQCQGWELRVGEMRNPRPRGASKHTRLTLK